MQDARGQFVTARPAVLDRTPEFKNGRAHGIFAGKAATLVRRGPRRRVAGGSVGGGGLGRALGAILPPTRIFGGA